VLSYKYSNVETASYELTMGATGHRQWPFFRALLSNAQMALTKANMKVAAEYAALCHDQELAQRIFGMIRDEYERTVRQVLEISESKELLDENPILQLSLSRRDPYLDPLKGAADAVPGGDGMA